MNSSDLEDLYHTPYQKIWELKSTLKTRPRRIINFQEKGDFFPKEKQPFLYDSRISILGEEVTKKISILSFYKHLMDITDLEIKLINTTCNKILLDELDVKYEEHIKLDILSVIIDEYYHVYMAKDIIIQIKKYYPDIENYKVPESDAYYAFKAVIDGIDIKYRDMFQVIAICIFETTLVKELIELFNSSKVNSSIKLYIEDHINDEAKHCNFFTQLLSYSWDKMNDEYKDVIGKNLPNFLIKYFSISSWRKFNKDVIVSFTNDEALSEEIVSELYDNFDINLEIPIVKNMILMLSRVGITKNINFIRQMQVYNWDL